MKRFTLLLTVAAGLAFTTLARADTMTKRQYQDFERSIESDAKAGLSRCDSLAANAKDICVAEVNGKEQVAKAELEARYEPTAKTRNAVHVAKAEAAYKVSIQRCDDMHRRNAGTGEADIDAVDEQRLAEAIRSRHGLGLEPQCRRSLHHAGRRPHHCATNNAMLKVVLRTLSRSTRSSKACGPTP